MVKNTTGGSKHKGQARKFVNTPRQTTNIRLSNDECELYAQVTKMLGNGMCHVLCIDGKTRLCHIRGKFRGRGKRDNLIANNSWLLIGLREWESDKNNEKKMQNCDLLEVYSQIDVDRLKNTVNENWNLFNNNDGKKISEDDVLFIDERTDEYMKLVEEELAQNNNANNKNSINIVFNEEEEINVDDI
jgi:translation initiation factor 1A